MPGEMNGRELANWATKKYPRLKVLLTTASEKEAAIEQPVSSQRFPLLSKPYTIYFNKLRQHAGSRVKKPFTYLYITSRQ